MRIRLSVCCLWIGLLALPAVADDQARAIFDAAVKAHGGAANLSKVIAISFKLKGTNYTDGMEDSYAFESTIQGLDKIRNITFGKTGAVEQIEIANGKQGWSKPTGKNAEELSEESLKSLKEIIYLNWVTAIFQTPGDGYQFSLLEENSVGDRKAVGIQLAHPAHESLRLYFDKENHLLLKHQKKVKDGGENKFVEEVGLYSDYRNVQGTWQAYKLESYLDGVRCSRSVLTEVKLYDKPLDEKIFAKP